MQYEKAPFSIVLTPLPIIIEVSFPQREKDPLPILLTLFGIVIVTNSIQSANILNIDNQQLMN